MLRYATLRSRTPIVFASAILILIALAFAFRDPVNSQDRSDGDIQIVENSLQVNDIIRSLPIAANDVVYNQFDQKLYVSSPSTAGSIGNTVSRIDPLSGQVLNSIFVGSEPSKLALSSDGQTLYVVLDGALAIRKVDLTSQTAGLEFPIGVNGTSNYFGALDLAVVPGNANRIAVARSSLGISPPENGVAIFDDGVALPLTGPGHVNGVGSLAFASPTQLYGGAYRLRTMTVSDSGVVDIGVTSTFSVDRIKYENARIYTSTGQVVEPQGRTILGTFPIGPASTKAFVPDAVAGRVLYAFQEQFAGSVTVKAYEISTYALTGSLALPGVTALPIAMVRYGGNGLALITSEDKRLHLIQTSLIPTIEPLPTPSLTPNVSPTPSPTSIPASVQRMSLVTKDVVYHAPTNRLMVSMPSTAGNNGNSVGIVDPFSARLDSTSFIGSEPSKLALSSDGQVLWVGLDGATSVRRFDTTTNTAGMQFSIGPTLGGQLPIQDIAVLPGSVNTIAVSGSPTSGVALFDNGEPRGSVTSGSGIPKFRTANELVIGNPGSSISRYAVTTSGFTLLGTLPGYYGDFKVADGGRLFYTNGFVVDAAASRVIGRFYFEGQAYSVAVDERTRRIFFQITSSGSVTIRAFDMDTFRPIGSIAVPSGDYVPTSLLRWGTDGLAWRDDGGNFFIIRSALVDPSTILPTPTPSTSPTPAVSPTPAAATFVRPLSIPVADVVTSSLTNHLHVSVPGIGGPELGNSIVRIDPSSGDTRSATFIGNEPGRLAISSDGGTLYCRLDGAGNAVRRFDLTTDAAGLQFAGPSSQTDMRVMPGNPQSVGIVSSESTPGAGVSIWDNGVQRGSAANGEYAPIYTIDFSSPSTIYGCGYNGTCFEFGVSANGVGPRSPFSNWVTGSGFQISAFDGLIFASSGRIFSPSLGAVVGSFFQPFGVMAVDRPANRVYFVSATQLAAYDLTTFLKIGVVPLQLTGNPTRVVRWGSNGLAVRTSTGAFGSNDGRLYLIQSSLVSPISPIPTGLQLGNSTYSASEGISSALQVAVMRTGDLSIRTTVSYETVNGTAIAGSDYFAASGNLVFAPGESSKNISIQLINDSVFETAESFGISLTQTSDGNTFIVSPRSAAISIFDNDFRPGVSGSNRRVSEVAQTVLIPINLTNPSVETVSVNYATSNGTAQAGSDYAPVSGVLTFAPLETSKSVRVTIINDGVTESDETFILVLNNAINGTIFSTNPIITITDAGYSISGRVTTPGGQGLRNAIVTLIDSNGERVAATTSSFGAYQFTEILSGQTVTISVASKRYRFAPRIVPVTGNLANVDFVGLE